MVSPIQYFQEVLQELKKVSWPNRIQTQEKTLVVLAASVILGLYLGLADTVFQRLIGLLINR